MQADEVNNNSIIIESSIPYKNNPRELHDINPDVENDSKSSASNSADARLAHHQQHRSQSSSPPTTSTTLILVEKMENLRLSQQQQQQQESTDPAAKYNEAVEHHQQHQLDEHLTVAGHITAVIQSTGTIVIKLAASCQILDIGSPVFARESAGEDERAICPIGEPVDDNSSRRSPRRHRYREIGFVSDIFGPVNHPMYSIEPRERPTSTTRDSLLLLRMGSKVFYRPDHPSTRYISVARDDDNQYRVIHH